MVGTKQPADQYRPPLDSPSSSVDDTGDADTSAGVGILAEAGGASARSSDKRPQTSMEHAARAKRLTISAHAPSNPSELDAVELSVSGSSKGGEDLCEECATICFDEETIMSQMSSLQSSKYIHGFVKLDEKCMLCDLFRKTIEHYKITGPTGSHPFYCIEAIRFDGVPGVMLKLSQLKDLGKSGWLLFGSNSAFPGAERLFARDIQSDKINWAAVKQWLQYCDTEHEDSCGSVKMMQLPGFRVIDCTTRRIVEAPKECKFVALSYVWGSDSSPGLRLKLPTKVPLLIEDAITCTKAIGLRYLWIDRYCIDQESGDSKHTLIRNMDQIYSGAAVTIINVAGTSSHSGLPGVSHTTRRPLASVSVHNKSTSLRLLPNSRAEVAESKWSTRGWTYQEGLLPRRRLVFTSSQIYFQRLEMHSCEVLPIHFLTRDTTTTFGRALGRKMRVFPSLSRMAYADTVELRIEEYLQRELSYESDVLNAIMGILRHICVHFWGLPIDSPRRYCPRAFGANEGFLAALMWIPEAEGSKLGISRRAGFPSWSWAAWKGITGIGKTYLLY
ncbi:HET-domain-containing protein [Cucurbitaria berberidis CBS 394.84]|uniref:HET-domain-containing protein n=1 Tax=Cucurbitaria berberidis CBS 394.84 TaxID=1168544 RepID=A0A9P4GS41_9PLEO|nr:HET-domain-containing protein [Cucurbitaria berberidis CBS 394.84]KAF1850740.1 HET-domain-containing protein [Cucurbitaria berberidis CBS 394.84]